MTPTEIAAWWGAVIATAVLLWDFFKWKNASKPKVKLSLLPNKEQFDGGINGVTFSHFETELRVSNVGSLTVTVDGLALYICSSLADKEMGRLTIFKDSEAIDDIDLGKSIGPGEQWKANIYQTNRLEEASRNSLLYVGVKHSLSPDEILERLTIPVREKNA